MYQINTLKEKYANSNVTSEDSISRLETLEIQNVKFNIIDKKEALRIMNEEFPLSRLLELSSIFEKYNSKAKLSSFVNLEFAQLYYLAQIDEELAIQLMRICLEIEAQLKTILINNIYKLGVADEFLQSYIKNDYVFLSRYFKEEADDYMNYPHGFSDNYSFESFLYTLPYGVLERIFNSFYKKYAIRLHRKNLTSFSSFLNSVRQVRNCVAHNGSIISKLNIIRGQYNPQVSAYLREHGIGERTLKTNLSKTIIFDICNVLHLYCLIEPQDHIDRNVKELKTFINESRKKYKTAFSGNQSIISAFRFFRDVNQIYSKKIKNF